jgi:hypothetical protein
MYSGIHWRFEYAVDWIDFFFSQLECCGLLKRNSLISIMYVSFGTVLLVLFEPHDQE